MLSSCAWPVRSRQTAAAPTPPAIAGIAMHAPSRKRLFRIGSRPVNSTRPPASSAPPPIPRIKSAKVLAIENASPVAASAVPGPIAPDADPKTTAPADCNRSRRVGGIGAPLGFRASRVEHWKDVHLRGLASPPKETNYRMELSGESILAPCVRARSQPHRHSPPWPGWPCRRRCESGCERWDLFP